MVDKLLNLILTLNCPTVSIEKFALAPFDEFKFDSFNLLKSPPKLSIKNCSLTEMPEGIRAPMSISNLLSIKFVPLKSIEIAPSTKEVASMELFRLMSGFLGVFLDGKWQKWPRVLWNLLWHWFQNVGWPLSEHTLFLWLRGVFLHTCSKLEISLLLLDSMHTLWRLLSLNSLLKLKDCIYQSVPLERQCNFMLFSQVQRTPNLGVTIVKMDTNVTMD